MEAKDRKAFIRVRISLAKKSIATASQAEGEQKKLKHHGENGRWLHRLLRSVPYLEYKMMVKLRQWPLTDRIFAMRLCRLVRGQTGNRAH
jgi:hypothetical protein